MRIRKTRKYGRSQQTRKVDTRNLKSTFLIVCEGKKTEPNYFKGFRAIVKTHDIEIQGIGANTLSVVQSALERINRYSYDEVWCVFDRDSFSPERFNQALELAKQMGINVAYSNEAFEIWYLLHFQYYDTGLRRNQYKNKLSKQMNRQYFKNDPTMFVVLEDKMHIAIRNAKRLRQSYGIAHDPAKDNPCTTVFELVEKTPRILLIGHHRFTTVARV